MKKTKDKNKRKFETSLLIIFICIALLAGSTFAWFTSTATIKGNKIFAGNLYVDVITDEQSLIEAKILDEEHGLDFGGNTVHIDGVDEDIPLYHRSFSDDASTETYFKLTDLTVPFLALYNVEPGQAFPVKFGVLNSGDLAIKYTAGFSIQPDTDHEYGLQSYTGLETLEKQKNETFATFHNKYIGDNITNDRGNYYELGTMDDKLYNDRKEKLELIQRDADGNDIGGHLEDVLEVYAVDRTEGLSNINSDGSINRSVINDHNYIGTVRQVIDALSTTDDNNPGPILNASARPGNTGSHHRTLDEVRDHLNMSSVGYCLPQETIRNDQGKFIKDGVSVKIANANGDVTETKTNVSEIGTVDYVIYMPIDVDNRYQNASLFLDIGVSATQVEFEYDGLNCMIYDKLEETPKTLRVANITRFQSNDQYEILSNMNIIGTNELTNDDFSDDITLNVNGSDMTLHTYTFDDGAGHTFDYVSFTEDQIMFTGDPFQYINQTVGYIHEGFTAENDIQYIDAYNLTIVPFFTKSDGSLIDTRTNYYNEEMDDAWYDITKSNHRYKDRAIVKVMTDLYDMENSPEDPEMIYKYLHYFDDTAHLVLKPDTVLAHGGMIFTITNPRSNPSAR